MIGENFLVKSVYSEARLLIDWNRAEQWRHSIADQRKVNVEKNSQVDPIRFGRPSGFFEKKT